MGEINCLSTCRCVCLIAWGLNVALEPECWYSDLNSTSYLLYEFDHSLNCSVIQLSHHHLLYNLFCHLIPVPILAMPFPYIWTLCSFCIQSHPSPCHVVLPAKFLQAPDGAFLGVWIPPEDTSWISPGKGCFNSVGSKSNRMCSLQEKRVRLFMYLERWSHIID